MQVIGNNVILLRDEISTCPPNHQWGIGMLRVMGLQDNFCGRLATMSRCVEILKGAGYNPIVVENAEEAEKVARELKTE